MSNENRVHYVPSAESDKAACGLRIDTGTTYLNFSRVSLDLVDCECCLLISRLQQQLTEANRLVDLYAKAICIYGREESELDFINDAECLQWFTEYTDAYESTATSKRGG